MSHPIESEQPIVTPEVVEPKKVLAKVTPPTSEAVVTITSEREEILQRLSEGPLVPQTLPKEEVSKLPPEQSELFATLESRFGEKPRHYLRPKGIYFAEVKKALLANPALMNTLSRMEETGGEPDVIAIEGDTFVFGDCSAESPSGRRNLNYDQATQAAKDLGVELMSTSAYVIMQTTGTFDRHTQSLLKTSADILSGGNALYGTRSGNGGRVSYRDVQDHNNISGWRGVLRVPRV